MTESLPSWSQTVIPLDVTISRQANATLNAPFVRLWQAFLTGRVLLAAALVLLQVSGIRLQATVTPLIWTVCLSYLALTLVLRWTAGRHLPAPRAGLQWLPVIGVDIAAIFLLQMLQAGTLNYTALLAIPILISAALGSLPLAFGTTASVTILMLILVSWQNTTASGGGTQAYYQTAFACAGYFGVAYLTHELARRVRRERALALYNRLRTQTQEQVNTLVIDSLSDGVLVIDPSLQVQQVNPAALQLLGLPPNHGQSFSLAARPAWEPLKEAVIASFTHVKPLSTTIHLQVDGQQGLTGLHLRTRITEVTTPDANSKHAQGSPYSLCVMFLHDLREMEARLRTEKLAAMGRMSAAVAHEIRNPLAAIAQANALLSEDLNQHPGQQQLCRIVGQNADRLARIAEEILNIARVQQDGQQAMGQALALDRHTALCCGEWQAQAAPLRGLQLHLGAAQHSIVFDEEHLRRILVNLLDNAQRHRSGTQDAASLQVITSQGSAMTGNQPWLQVWSDGAPLESSVQRHLFEPFFSSQSRSSGLGLYICRELCERYGASIGYQRLARPTERGMVEGNAFTVMFRSSAATPATPATPAAASLFDSIVV